QPPRSFRRPPWALTLVLLVLASAISVFAESHTVKFDNRCGYGTPQLIKGGDVLTTTSYESSGELAAAVAFNGENCTLLELTMTNPVAVGGGSSADISLIDPHKYSVPTRIEFYGGCDGISTTCDSPSCKTAFFHPDDTWVQIACQEDNANLLITFCPDGSSSSPNTSSTATTKVKTTADSQTTSKKMSPSTTSSPDVSTSTPIVAASSSASSTSAPVCKHKHSERRAISAHRKRGSGRSFHS
ncbi:hypothetical protein B0H14DRAFT_2668553, partial [Mycena olivaceomarginata]